MVVYEYVIAVFLHNENDDGCFDLQRVNCCMAGWTAMTGFRV